MVTIEQKLTLFSKLLNQDIKEETDKKFKALEEEYEKRMAENKFEVDKQVTEIIEQARRRAEIKKVELISKGKLCSKKEMMQIKEKLMTRFMKRLDEKIKAFIDTEDYKAYLKKLIQSIVGLEEVDHQLEVYLTEWDYERNQIFIGTCLTQLGLKSDQLVFKKSEEPILGGLVIKDRLLSTRMDLSIKTLMDDKRDMIVEKISIAIGEAGEQAHD